MNILKHHFLLIISLKKLLHTLQLPAHLFIILLQYPHIMFRTFLPIYGKLPILTSKLKKPFRATSFDWRSGKAKRASLKDPKSLFPQGGKVKVIFHFMHDTSKLTVYFLHMGLNHKFFNISSNVSSTCRHCLFASLYSPYIFS